MFEQLPKLAGAWGIALPETAPALFEKYATIMLEENKHTNLTRITDTQEVMIKHFLDSLALLAQGNTPEGPILDVGTGAGLPGIPLKIAQPEIKVTLLDSLQKRVDFLLAVAASLDLQQLSACHGRAEDLARTSEFRDQFPVVVSRAVARLNVLAELCLPYAAVGGVFVAYKGPEGAEELREAAFALQELGCDRSDVWSYSLPESMGARTLVFMHKTRKTPQKYPRRAGVPAKKPLL